MSTEDSTKDVEKPHSAAGGSEPEETRSEERNASEAESESDPKSSPHSVENPPLPDEEAPPLPDEPQPPLPVEEPPRDQSDDGWAPVWDDTAQAYYFYNRFTNATQWENPRVPEATQSTAPTGPETTKGAVGGYNPAIHGDYDPNADYAKPTQTTADGYQHNNPTNAAELYGATGTFNRFTGKWQNADFTPERFSDESKSKRQMNAFFDVDAAANSHDGRSLKAERANKKISKKELQAFKDKRRDKKEEKRRAWLRD